MRARGQYDAAGSVPVPSTSPQAPPSGPECPALLPPLRQVRMRGLHPRQQQLARIKNRRLYRREQRDDSLTIRIAVEAL